MSKKYETAAMDDDRDECQILLQAFKRSGRRSMTGTEIRSLIDSIELQHNILRAQLNEINRVGLGPTKEELEDDLNRYYANLEKQLKYR